MSKTQGERGIAVHLSWDLAASLWILNVCEQKEL